MAQDTSRDREHAATILLVVVVGVVSVVGSILVMAGQQCSDGPDEPLLCTDAGLTVQLVQMWVVGIVAVVALALTRRVRTAAAGGVRRAARLPIGVALGNLLFMVLTSLVLVVL